MTRIAVVVMTCGLAFASTAFLGCGAGAGGPAGDGVDANGHGSDGGVAGPASFKQLAKLIAAKTASAPVTCDFTSGTGAPELATPYVLVATDANPSSDPAYDPSADFFIMFRAHDSADDPGTWSVLVSYLPSVVHDLEVTETPDGLHYAFTFAATFTDRVNISTTPGQTSAQVSFTTTTSHGDLIHSIQCRPMPLTP